jgi:hypothetical protein
VRATVKELAFFKVYVDPRNRKLLPFFFYCSVWKNVIQARDYMQKLDSNPDNPDIKTAAGACCSWTQRSYRPGHEGDLHPCLGHIVLAESYSGSSLIAHECSHAAFRLGELITGEKIDDPYDPEERHCLTVGYMTRAIIRRLIKLRERK